MAATQHLPTDEALCSFVADIDGASYKVPSCFESLRNHGQRDAARRYPPPPPRAVEAPKMDIHSFIGRVTVRSPALPSMPATAGRVSPEMPAAEALGLEHTLWCNTVIASSTVIGRAGAQARAAGSAATG
mgnify:CR=1 FL=1